MARRFPSRKCAVCAHPERFKIELQRAGGASCKSLAEKYGLPSLHCVWNHWRHHVSDKTKAELIVGPVQMHELAQRAAAEGMNILDYVALLRTRLLALFSNGAEVGDRHSASSLAGRLIELLRFQAQLSGQLAEYGRAGVNIVNNVAVLNSPDFARLQAAIIAALNPYPEARAAVILALRSLEVADEPAGTPLSLEASSVGGESYAAA